MFITPLAAAQLLSQGEIVAIPTETVYGLAARIDRPLAIERIFTTKERPFFDPLIVHVATYEQLNHVCLNVGPVARLLSENFWPGPFTLVLPKHPKLNEMITSGLPTVAVRMPNHPLALNIIQQLEAPVAAPSANKFGKTSPTSAQHVSKEFGPELAIVDGGPCSVGIESTILLVKEGEVAELEILRKGIILKSDIENLLKKKNINYRFIQSGLQQHTPGQMKHHYMPDIPLILYKNKKNIPLQYKKQIELKLNPDPRIACREIYAQLRICAESGADAIVFQMSELPPGEAWEPLFERLYKAASLNV